MKTTNKVLALVEIAVVLCSVFLVALPAIAADQNQEIQKISTNMITAASEDNFVLGVYGNANEDDTIDMRDLTYVKLIFFGKKPETELSDAKYDGKINPLDFIQIKLIIVGKEKEITIVDSADRIVTVKKPIERSVVFGPSPCEVMRALKLDTGKIIVGVPEVMLTTESYTIYFPELRKAESIGIPWKQPDYEAIIKLQPDIVLMSSQSSLGCDESCNKLESIAPQITVVRFECARRSTYADEVRKMGYIFGKTKEADEYIDFYCGILNTIEDKVKGIPDDKKPKVYCERWGPSYGTGGKGDVYNDIIELTGGRNIAEFEGYKNVDPEWVVKQNPDIIIRGTLTGYHGMPLGGCGYPADDVTGMKKIRDEIMNRPELAYVTAVKTGRVYIFCYVTSTGSNMRPLYFAKWFHPDIFEDLDPQAIHQEYLSEFQGLDYDLDKHGVFVYHPEEHPDGK